MSKNISNENKFKGRKVVGIFSLVDQDFDFTCLKGAEKKKRE